MISLMAFLRLSRPHFLMGGALMYAVGVAQGEAIGIATYLLGQAMVSAAQVTAHYVNEYADVEADRLVKNRTIFSGGSGVLVEGGLGSSVAMRAARVSTAVALFCAVAIARTSPLAAILGLVALVVSWFYSIPPVRLLGTGFGEAVTSAVVVGVVPLIGIAMTGGGPTTYLWWLIAALLPVHFAMMLIFELPDLETDRRANKRVLAVRVGKDATMVAISALIVLAFSIVAIGIFTGRLPHGLWWSAGSIAVGGILMVAAASRAKHQLSTVAAVATLAGAAGPGLVASL
ncbi:MAG: prenyltransferase [Polyangiales bacterium]